jgi:hypothetical protein
MAGAYIFMLLLFFVILVAISRWIFRVNDIVKRLDKIVTLLESQRGDIK